MADFPPPRSGERAADDRHSLSLELRQKGLMSVTRAASGTERSGETAAAPERALASFSRRFCCNVVQSGADAQTGRRAVQRGAKRSGETAAAPKASVASYFFVKVAISEGGYYDTPL